MRIAGDSIWLCDFCLQAAVNDDYSSLDYHFDQIESAERMLAIAKGLRALGPNLVPDFTDTDGVFEFSTIPCACCGDPLHGARHRFAILEPVPYCDPLCAGLDSEPRKVASRLGRLLTALENEVTGNVVQGPILEDIVRCKRELFTRLKAEGWRITYLDDSQRYKVLPPKP